MPTLAEYVTEIMTRERLSTYDVAKRAGQQITQSNVHRIANGLVLHPGANKLKALSKGLGTPEYELFAIVRGVDPHAQSFANEQIALIDQIYSRLTAKQKTKADYILDLLTRELERIEAEKEDISLAA